MARSASYLHSRSFDCPDGFRALLPGFQGPRHAQGRFDPFSAPVLAVRSTAVSGRKIINIREHASWTGATTRRFFLEPQQTFHRQYEALRAVFVDDEPLDRVAERFGYKPSALRSMASRLRADCRRGVTPPFFSPTAADDPSVPVPAKAATGPGDARSRRLPRAEPRRPAARSARASRASSSSCPSWPGSASIASSPRPGIPARRWSPPPAPCSRSWR